MPELSAPLAATASAFRALCIWACATTRRCSRSGCRHISCRALVAVYRGACRVRSCGSRWRRCRRGGGRGGGGGRACAGRGPGGGKRGQGWAGSRVERRERAGRSLCGCRRGGTVSHSMRLLCAGRAAVGDDRLRMLPRGMRHRLPAAAPNLSPLSSVGAPAGVATPGLPLAPALPQRTQHTPVPASKATAAASAAGRRESASVSRCHNKNATHQVHAHAAEWGHAQHGATAAAHSHPTHSQTHA